MPTADYVDRPLPQPDVSVIVALPDDRGLAIECVESLVRGQTYPQDRFEVIVVADGSDPALFAPGPEYHLALTCSALRPWTIGIPDRRVLGLPIFSIGFRRTAEAVSDGDQRPSPTFRQMRFDSLFSKGRRS